MSSKNNPLNRQRDLNKKTVGGKVVKPVKFIGLEQTYMAAMFEDGKMAMDPRTNLPLAFAAAS